ncbi:MULTISPECIES: hypothetical protein [Microcystis]|uniref:Uncharacterized protein n=1 Tax=Microcystis viridis FACHB-1342 TaxID=2692900 RepID=A0ABR8G7Y4_MICVR|nr:MULTISPECIES: hypothetical protein [Microcystis]MBD2599244.1 hypothetical protein [Microcystis viridis FACHB-1342]MDB9386024.1 hypothetical protein [Microcystis aeruginosa CS-583]ODV35935.1 hypothetical protein BFG60_4685 [Microcystis aeruginosa NIES-98]
MVRSPKSSAGAVGATLGNAPYGDGDRTSPDHLAIQQHDDNQNGTLSLNRLFL